MFFKKEPDQVRQGDIFLMEVEVTDELLASFGKEEALDHHISTAYGEATGHKHALKEDEAYIVSVGGREKQDRYNFGAELPVNDNRFLVLVKDNPVLVHSDPTHTETTEHFPIKLEPKISKVYRIHRQRQYHPDEEPVAVVD